MSDFQEAYNAGVLAAFKPVLINGVPHGIVPNGAGLRVLEETMGNPIRKAAAPVFDEAGSFARYVEAFRDPRSRLFAHAAGDYGRFVCILDYHEGANLPAHWMLHRPSYVCPHSEEWKLWCASNAKWMPQREFAEFIESNTAQIVSPSAAEFLEVAQTLASKTTAAFTGSTRLDSGRDQIDYQLTSEAKSGEKGNFPVPTLFTLGLPVFAAGPRYEIKARLRYKITEGRKLELRYELVNAPLVIRAAWDELVTTVAKATKLEVYLGRA